MDTLELMKTLETLRDSAGLILSNLKPELMNLQIFKWELDGVHEKITKANEILKQIEAQQESVRTKCRLIEEECKKKCEELESLKRQELLEVRRKIHDLDLLISDASKKKHLAMA